MIIHLNADWRLESDPQQWTLKRRQFTTKGDNIGREYWVAEAFTGTLDGAVMACANKMIRFVDVETDSAGLMALIAKLDELKAAMSSLATQDGGVRHD